MPILNFFDFIFRYFPICKPYSLLFLLFLTEYSQRFFWVFPQNTVVIATFAVFIGRANVHLQKYTHASFRIIRL